MSDKITTIEEQLRTLRSSLILSREILDEAADAGNVDVAKSLQADIAATEALIASCERRIEKAKKGFTESEKAAMRRANLHVVDQVEQHLRDAATVAVQIEATLASLVKQLAEIHASGAAARKAAADLVKQLPERQQEQYWSLLNAVGFADNSLAVFIEDNLANAGVFNELAPHHLIQLTRHGLPPLRDGVAERATKLPKALARLAEQVNASI